DGAVIVWFHEQRDGGAYRVGQRHVAVVRDTPPGQRPSGYRGLVEAGARIRGHGHAFGGMHEDDVVGEIHETGTIGVAIGIDGVPHVEAGPYVHADPGVIEHTELSALLCRFSQVIRVLVVGKD